MNEAVNPHLSGPDRDVRAPARERQNTEDPGKYRVESPGASGHRLRAGGETPQLLTADAGTHPARQVLFEATVPMDEQHTGPDGPIPSKYLGNYRQAQTGRRPLGAIRSKCLDCMCWQEVEVRRCQNTDCPLWRYRMGRMVPVAGPGASPSPDGLGKIDETEAA